MSIGNDVLPMPKGGVGCGTSIDNGANAPCISMYLGYLGRVMFVVLTQGV